MRSGYKIMTHSISSVNFEHLPLNIREKPFRALLGFISNNSKIIFWTIFYNFKGVVGAQSFQIDFSNSGLLGVRNLKISENIKFVFKKWVKIKNNVFLII